MLTKDRCNEYLYASIPAWYAPTSRPTGKGAKDQAVGHSRGGLTTKGSSAHRRARQAATPYSHVAPH